MIVNMMHFLQAKGIPVDDHENHEGKNEHEVDDYGNVIDNMTYDPYIRRFTRAGTEPIRFRYD